MLSPLQLQETLIEKNIAFRVNEDLKRHNSFKVEAVATTFIEITDLQTLCLLQKILLELQQPWFFLGGGSNILLSDKPLLIPVIFVNSDEKFQILEKQDNFLKVRANASCRASWFARKVSNMGFTGLEFLTTIPGQIGGAVIQNAGCYGYEISDTVYSITIIENGSSKSIDSSYARFSYRSSLFKTRPDLWVHSVDFTLEHSPQEDIDIRLERFKKNRIDSQPRNRRSAGSIFKNPLKKISEKRAWQLIEDAGLRGVGKGTAEISQEHCNFIVNKGGATASDVYYLILLIEKTVHEKFGIVLEREVLAIGDFEHVTLE